MLTDEQIIDLYKQWSDTPGSTHADLMQAAYAQALKDAADACGAVPVPESCNATERALWAVAAEEHAAAILALGKERQ